jgi:hypothetical protein
MHRQRSLIDLHALPELFAHRIVRVTELISLGLSTNLIYANTRLGGPWQRLLPGIVLLSNAPPNRAQLVQAALRYGGRDALLTGHDALQLHGLRTARPGGPVHILVPHRRQARSVPTVLVERTVRLPHIVLRKDFPVAPVERAVLDSVRRMPAPDAVRAIIAESVRRLGVRPARLDEELANGSGRGTALVREVLTEITNGVHSVAEAWARRLVVNSGLPRPVWNVPLCAPDGQLIGIANAWWEDAGLAWEIDSAEWYDSPTSPTSYEETLTRAARQAAAGITVLRTQPSRLRRDPTAVLRDLEQALARAHNRPRPRILAG